MAKLTVNMAYGNALYRAAEELDQIDPMAEELVALRDILEKETDFFTLLLDPAIPGAKKKEIIEQVFHGRISEPAMNFLFVLVDKNRMRYFSQIIREFQRIRNEEAGVLVGTAYSAAPLREDQIHQMEEETSQLLHKKVQLENQIDPKLIGGVRVMVGGRVIDASLKKRLEDLAGFLRA